MYGAVDLLVVGHFGDASSVSAVSTGSQIMRTITGIISGLTMGTTVLLDQKVGGKDSKGAANTVGGTIIMFSIIAVILSIIMMFAARPFTSLMHTPSAAFDKTVEYVFICSAGIIFIIAYNVISGIFRGLGNSYLPLLFVGIACVCNIIGDIVLVGIFRLDAAGAAMATVIAQAVSVILSIIIIRKRVMGFPFSRKDIRFHPREMKGVLRLGSPIALQGCADQHFLPDFYRHHQLHWSDRISRYRCQRKGRHFYHAGSHFLYVLRFCLYRSKRWRRKAGTGTQSHALCNDNSTVLWRPHVSVDVLRGGPLAGIFSKDLAVVAASAEYMKAYAINCVLVCVLFCYMGYFNGSGKTVFVMLQGVFAAILVRIPFSYFVSKMKNATMLEIGFASPVATVFSIILCVLYYRHTIHKKSI